MAVVKCLLTELIIFIIQVLRLQMAALEEKKEEEKRLKQEERQLLLEQEMLRKIEEQRAWEDKVRQQNETRDMLDMSLQLKMKKKAKLEQEQLAFDLKILEQLLEESRNEALEQLQKKVLHFTEYAGCKKICFIFCLALFLVAASTMY